MGSGQAKNDHLQTQACHAVNGDSMVSYDLTKRKDVVQYIILLVKLRGIANALWKRYCEARERFLKKIQEEQDSMIAWTLRSQLLEYSMKDKTQMEIPLQDSTSKPQTVQEVHINADDARENRLRERAKKASETRKRNREAEERKTKQIKEDTVDRISKQAGERLERYERRGKKQTDSAQLQSDAEEPTRESKH